jgi:hypothetical protein
MVKLLRPLSALFFALAIGIYFKFFHMQPNQRKPRPTHELTQTVSPTPAKVADETEQSLANGSSTYSAASPDVAAIAAGIKFTPPRLSDFREHNGSNDDLLIDFANELAPNMEKSKESVHYAKAFFAKLRDCAEDRSGIYAVSIRAACLLNAEKLAQIHSEAFGQAIIDLKGKVDPKVDILARALKGS